MKVKRIATKRNLVNYFTLGAFGTVTTFWTEPPKTRTVCGHAEGSRTAYRATNIVEVPNIAYVIRAKKIVWLTFGFYKFMSVLQTAFSDNKITDLKSRVYFNNILTDCKVVCLFDLPKFYFFFFRSKFDLYLINRFWTSEFNQFFHTKTVIEQPTHNSFSLELVDFKDSNLADLVTIAAIVMFLKSFLVDLFRYLT